MAGARTRRVPWCLTLGHVAVLIAAVLVTALLVSLGVTDAGDLPLVIQLLGLAMPLVGALSLVVGQILSVRKLAALAPASAQWISIDQLTRSIRRSRWPVLLALYATTIGLPFLLEASLHPLVSTLYLLLILTALHLERSHAEWLHRRLHQPDHQRRSVVHRQLPPDIGARLRRSEPFLAGAYTLYGVVAAVLLVATVVTEHRYAAGPSPGTFVQIAAAVAATTVPFLHIRASSLMRAAVSGDLVCLAALRRAGASFIRAGAVATPATALVITSIPATPAAPGIAIGRSALLLHVLVIATLHAVSASAIHVGEFPERRHSASDELRP